jgi:3-oxoacyl-[acyl-carrier protein] reductase
MAADTRVSVVTGATSGIGHALALALARRGDRVVAIGRNPTRLAATAAALATAGPADHLTLALDVANPADMGTLRATLEDVGRADLLIASAVLGRTGTSVLPPRTRDLPLADWQAMIDVNLHGVFLACQAVLPLMRAAGDGDIVNIASSTTPHGLRGTPLAPAYCAAKFAIAAMGRELAQELAPEGIRVRTVFPGSVDTPLIADTMLDAPFGGRMRPESFATALLGLIDLGREMALPDPHLLPVPQKGHRSPGRPG